MKKMLAVLSMVLCLFMSWNPVGADVINFESLSPFGGTTPFSLYQEAGYSLTNNTDQVFGEDLGPTPNAFGWWATGYSAGYAGSLGLFNNYWQPAEFGGPISTTLTKDDNTPFGLSSIDLSKLSLSEGAGSVIFTGIKSDNSTVAQTVDYSAALGFQTFLFSSDFNNLKSLSWVPASDTAVFQFDNITMSASAAVPEPTTMLLLGFGLIGLAGMRRKKR